MTFEALEKRLQVSVVRFEKLNRYFTALVQGDFKDKGLHDSVRETCFKYELPLATLAATIPAAMATLGTAYDRLAIAEADFMVSSMEQAQRRVRLLLRSGREIFCRPEDRSDAAYELVSPSIEAEIMRIHFTVIPYSYQTVQTMPQSPKPEDRLKVISGEHQKLEDGIMQSPLSPEEMAAFYAPYKDMSADPVADYKDNTHDLFNSCARIGEIALDRAQIMLTQRFLYVHIPEPDLETAQNMTARGVEDLRRAAPQLSEGARQYLDVLKSYRP